MRCKKIQGGKMKEEVSFLESLLWNKNVPYGLRWHPKAVSTFENELKKGKFLGMNVEQRKNLVYSFQYLQFLQLQLEELHLHDIIRRLIEKTYIITALSVIESIFYHIVKSSGNQKKSDWIIDGKIQQTNPFKESGIYKKIEICKYAKLSTPVDEQMDFEYLINKVEEKKLIEIKHAVFPYLKKLKKLRNKVHLQNIQFENDTDYLGITSNDYYLTRYILFYILSSKTFREIDKNVFSYLCVNKEKLSELSQYLASNKEKHNKKNS